MKSKSSLIIITILLCAFYVSAQEFGSFTDSRDGKIYKTVKLGKQTWMAENLAYKLNYGCWAYNDDENNVATYGYLYNWETAKKACPPGWHLPSDEEWETLITCLGSKRVAGGRMKECDTIHWKHPNDDANNISGFSALPGGFRSGIGSYRNIRMTACWWSSSENDAGDVWVRALYYNNGKVDRNYDYFMRDGLSVRCIKD